MTSMRRVLALRFLRCAIVAVAALLGVPISSSMAQAVPDSMAKAGRQASRSALEALAAEAERTAAAATTNDERRAQKRAEAEALRSRLRDGDFRAGDRIVLSVRGDSALTDTFTVSQGRTLDLPDQPAIALTGVLRAELEEYLTTHFARYFHEPRVEARPLLRIAVLGEVTRPGYYLTTPDYLVSDAIMAAGGPTNEADLTRTTVRRGETVFWKEADLRAAVIDGVTLDQLSLRSGDEIIVGERKRRNWDAILRTASLISGIALGIYGATRMF